MAEVMILIFSFTIVPSSLANLIFTKPALQNDTAPFDSENYSYWNITLPTVHINYEKNKWKWGVIQFEDFDPIIDVNLSRFEHETILIGFNETVKCHTQNQLLPASFLVTLEFFYNGSYVGGQSVGDYCWRIRNWTNNVVYNYCFSISKELNQTLDIDIQGKITATGIPVRLHRLYLSLILAIFWYIITEKTLLPFEERHGTTTEFTLHIHT